MKKLIFWQVVITAMALGVFYMTLLICPVLAVTEVTPGFTAANVVAGLAAAIAVGIIAVVAAVVAAGEIAVVGAVAVGAITVAVAVGIAVDELIVATIAVGAVIVAVVAGLVVAKDINAPKKWMVSTFIAQALIIFVTIKAFMP